MTRKEGGWRLRRYGRLAALLLFGGVTAGALEWTGVGSRILPRADLWLGPDRLEFGRVPVGSREQRVLIATNHGAEDVLLMRITAGSGFLVAPKSVSLAGQESREIVVTFVPEVEGSVKSRLVLDTDPLSCLH